MNEKKEIKCPVPYYIDSSYFEGDLNKIIKFLQELPEQIKLLYNPLGNSVYLNAIHRYEIQIGYDDNYDEFTVIGYRWETDEEFNKRIEVNKKASKLAKENAKKRKLELEKQEKENYLKLKAKYG